MHQHFAHDPDMEQFIIDSTIVRAHACAAGAPKKTVGNNLKHSVEAGAGSQRRFMSVSMPGHPVSLEPQGATLI